MGNDTGRTGFVDGAATTIPEGLFDVLYEDNHLLAANKPAGLLTQPSGRTMESLEDRTRAWIRHTGSKTGNVFVHAVHRLDRPTSGVVLFAKTSKALSRMNEQQRMRKIRKVYHAVVTGRLPLEEGTLSHTLRHSRMRSVVSKPFEAGAKECSLRYRVIGHSGRLTLVELELVTGRYHQIRAQLGASGCPVLGDVAYGGTPQPEIGGIALHHVRMEFEHPTKKTLLCIRAPYPRSWSGLTLVRGGSLSLSG